MSACQECNDFRMVLLLPYDHRMMHRWVRCSSCTPPDPESETT